MAKSSAPPPPDYAAAAQATAQGNLEAARAAAQANRANQITPWGTLTWSQNPTSTFDADAYNKALEAYHRALEAYNRQTSGQGREGGSGESWLGGFAGSRLSRRAQLGQGGSSGGSLIAPRREDFMRVNPDSGWEQRVTLTPEAQAALDQQLALNQKYGEVANIGFDRARSIFENPELAVRYYIHIRRLRSGFQQFAVSHSLMHSMPSHLQRLS